MLDLNSEKETQINKFRFSVNMYILLDSYQQSHVNPVIQYNLKAAVIIVFKLFEEDPGFCQNILLQAASPIKSNVSHVMWK